MDMDREFQKIMDVTQEFGNMISGPSAAEEYYSFRVRRETVVVWGVYLFGICVGYTIGRNR